MHFGPLPLRQYLRVKNNFWCLSLGTILIILHYSRLLFEIQIHVLDLLEVCLTQLLRKKANHQTFSLMRCGGHIDQAFCHQVGVSLQEKFPFAQTFDNIDNSFAFIFHIVCCRSECYPQQLVAIVCEVIG